MTPGHKRRARKQRRQQKAVLQHGKGAKPTHRLKGGRTGKVFSNYLKSLRP